MEKENNCLKRLAVVLPSLNPDEKFCNVVNQLVERGFEKIVIVDDGSDEDRQKYFERAGEYPQTHVLHHEVNMGKGRALKDAFRYVLDELPEAEGVITIDGDGQHLTEDIVTCGDRMLEEEDKVVMGCRDFNQPGVPPRSVTGNKTTAALFRICYGIKLSDTQTGLRAIPRKWLERFCSIEGERFEYETNMLLQMKTMGAGFVEQPITTVYDPEDYSSHYDAVKDSWRIFKVMFKFLMSSLGTTLFELIVFYLVLKLFGTGLGNVAELVATVVGRVLSSLLNFAANYKLVFANQGNTKRAFIRYYCLCIPQMLVSAGLITGINRLLANSLPFISTLIKLVVDTVLFFISYGIQREWVFSQKD